MGDRDKTYAWCPKCNHGVCPEDVNGAGKHKYSTYSEVWNA